MKKRSLLALLLALCLVIPQAVYAAAPGARAEAVHPLEELPAGWSPVRELTEEARLLLSLTTDTLYVLSEDGRELIPSMATSMPRDVTGEYAGTYGIPEGADAMYAYSIELDVGARWETGEHIDAVDWLFTLKLMLEYQLLELNVVGLEAEEGMTELLSDNVISLREANFSSVEEAREFGYQHFYVDAAGFWGLDEGWVSITSRERLEDRAIPSGILERYVSGAYLYDRYLRTEGELSMFQRDFVGICADPQYAEPEELGLIFQNSHRFVVILEEPMTQELLALKLSKLTLLREELYGDDYATSMETYCAYGPWRIASMDSSGIILEPNPYWLGKRQEVERIRLQTDIGTCETTENVVQ